MQERNNAESDTRVPPREPSVVRLSRHNGAGAPGVDLHERVEGSKPGSHFLRRIRPGRQKLRRVGEDDFEATPAALEPSTRLGRLGTATRRVLIGSPLASAELAHQRLSKTRALAVFSSDNVSSTAYATEEILIILIAAGTAALTKSIPVTAALILLTILVVTSYRQTIRAYPNGGGAYIVATENLGFAPGLFAGSSLIVDYIMTVAVSVAACVAAVTSAAPQLYEYKVPLSLVFVVLLTTANLRGVRESGTIFAIPTYFFIFSFGVMLLVGVVRIALGADLHAESPAHAIEPGVAALTPLLLLRAFSSGAAALTGIEAVANGVPNFKPPEWKNAIAVQAWMVLILATFFIGTTYLAHQMEIVPSESETVVSQIARTVFGHNLLFYMIQAGTAMILFLAANTAFAGLPMLASVMARDHVMPKQLSFRGDRLVFTNGIILLCIFSGAILIAFQAETTRIIPLYAFGVFMAFTLSQFGMVTHWRHHKEPGWRRALAINAIGGVATLVVAGIVGLTKFSHGAWLSMALMFGLAFLLWRIKVHYDTVERQLGIEGGPAAIALAYYAEKPTLSSQAVIVPVDGINRAVLETLAYARSISLNATALHVSFDREDAEQLRRQWKQSVPDVPLVVVDSPERSLVEPFFAYLNALERASPGQTVTVVLPELAGQRPWQMFLHNQSAWRLKRALLDRPNTVVAHVTHHLQN